MEKSIDEIFTTGLVKIRKERGLSQDAVNKYMQSRGFDWHSSTLSKIERGLRKITIGEAIALAQLFNVSIEKITGIIPVPNTVEKALTDLQESLDNMGNALSKLVESYVSLVEARKKFGDGEHDRDYIETLLENATPPYLFGNHIEELENVLTRRVSAMSDISEMTTVQIWEVATKEISSKYSEFINVDTVSIWAKDIEEGYGEYNGELL